MHFLNILLNAVNTALHKIPEFLQTITSEKIREISHKIADHRLEGIRTESYHCLPKSPNRKTEPLVFFGRGPKSARPSAPRSSPRSSRCACELGLGTQRNSRIRICFFVDTEHTKTWKSNHEFWFRHTYSLRRMPARRCFLNENWKHWFCFAHRNRIEYYCDVWLLSSERVKLSCFLAQGAYVGEWVSQLSTKNAHVCRRLYPRENIWTTCIYAN